jgi:hypothetical protein
MNGDAVMHDVFCMEVRPYQLLCLICRQGREDHGVPYWHEPRLDGIEAAIRKDPLVPLRLRCNTDTVYRYQNPGRAFDTPEGELYNDLRDLTILQKLGAVLGDTRPATEWFDRIRDVIPSSSGVCAYPEAESPGWPRCLFAASGNYERGMARGIGALTGRRTDEEKAAVKESSAAACLSATLLRIRPHHLMCLGCFHGGRRREELAPIREDNLFECIAAMQRNPDIPVELVAGPCMICPPCSRYHASSNLCIGGRSMGLRDQKKDLDTLRRLGLRYGDVLPAREILQRIFASIRCTTEICGNGTGIGTAPEWRVCGGPSGDESYRKARQSGLGVEGVAAVPTPV